MDSHPAFVDSVDGESQSALTQCAKEKVSQGGVELVNQTISDSLKGRNSEKSIMEHSSESKINQNLLKFY